MIDGTTTTTANVTIDTGDYLYIGMHAGDTDKVQPGATAFLKFRLTATLNTNAATMSTAEYSTGAGGWAALAGFSDGTLTGGKTLAQDGSMTFTRPGDWLPNELADANSSVKMWIRLRPSANLTSVGFEEIDFGATQAWEINARRSTDGVTFTAMTNASGETYATGTTTVITATGTGSIDVTLATPSRYVVLHFHCRATQTPSGDGSIYGQYTNVTVYTETGSINAQEITKDVRALVSELNADENRIGALTLSLVPFITWGQESYADILMRAAGFGDGSFNSWAVRLLCSEAAGTPNGEPVLELAQYPALTDFDYVVSKDEPNLVGGVEIVKDYAGVYNWIAVRYRDELDNRDVLLTPDDDANLKNTNSITDWGERHLPQPLDAGLTTATAAKNLARRFLSSKKDPQFRVAGPITVRGYIRTKDGVAVPSANIAAGKRIKLDNFLTDEVGVAGAGLTSIITHTRYEDTGETCAISAGVPDDLAVLIAQLAAFPDQTVF
jgi:hypothetical protein